MSMQTVDKQILILEDNKHSMNKVCNVLKDIPNIVILKAETIDKAYRYALEYDIDLFIVDIILDSSKVGDVSGMDFADKIRTIEKYEITPMIFTTSLEDPKLHAYVHLHCYQYFEKPYDIHEFKQAVLKSLKFAKKKIEKEYFNVKTDGMVFPIKTTDIVYFKVKSTNLIICCSDGDKLAAPYRSCKQILLELGSNRFLKCNNHMIINRDYVKVIDNSNRIVELKHDFGKFDIGFRLYKSFIEGFES